MNFGRFGLLLAIAGIAVVASEPVEAMTLVVQKGEVLVNRGMVFARSRVPSRLSRGARWLCRRAPLPNSFVPT